MIEIENVSHHHGHQQVLHDINLTIPKGGVTALVGPNGARQVNAIVADGAPADLAERSHPL